LGDWVDVSEIQDWQQTTYQFEVNDQVRQSGNTSDMIFDIGALLVEISHIFSLEAGDVIMTGTPAGVAALHSGEQLKMTLNGKTQDFVWNTWVK